jgi:hypothetical protein
MIPDRIKIFEPPFVVLVVPRFGSILKKSRRRLTGGIILLILGAIILGYSVPIFIKHARTIGKQDTSYEDDWPLEMILIMEQQRKEAYENFYRWTFFTSVGAIIFVCGLYFGVVKWWMRRTPEE